jgi:hypothetical protein
MDMFSWKFLLVLLAAVAILTMRARQKRGGPTIVRGKQISISGQKITTMITKETPLACIFDEGKLFGDDFKEKTPPSLPHSENCKCKLVSTLHRSHDWFNEKQKPVESFKTDLGELTRNEFRYYKYSLILHHRDAEEEDCAVYKELVEGISVNRDFKEKVRSHLSSA